MRVYQYRNNKKLYDPNSQKKDFYFFKFFTQNKRMYIIFFLNLNLASQFKKKRISLSLLTQDESQFVPSSNINKY